MRVAVLGAGLMGALAALRLAEAGHEVDLLDRRDLPLLGTARAGRLRLGHAFAPGRSPGAARALVRAAAAFRPLVGRWTGPALLEEHASAALLHVLPRDAPLTPEAARARLSHASRLAAALAGPYRLGVESRGWRELSPSEREGLFDPAEVAAAFATRETALDAAALAEALRAALAAAPRIALRPGHEVRSIAPEGAGIRVAATGPGGPLSECFAAVIDARRPGAGPARREVILRTRDPRVLGGLPAVAVLGRGDAAAFRDRAVLAWEAPGGPSDAPSRALGALRRLMPGAADALDDARGWQASDGPSGDDPATLVLAPLAAEEACRRLLPAAS